MKLYDVSVLFIVVMVMVLLTGLVSDRFLGDDNPVEESAEAIILDQTGISVDLSPQSKEKTK